MTQGMTIGSLSHTEEVDMGIVADAAPMARVILCPFATVATWDGLPASCEDVKASSKMVVTDVLATTVTNVGMSESPLDMHYEIDATGSGGAGTPAEGHIVAEFEVHVEDGSAWGVKHCTRGDITDFTLGSKLTHYEKSIADGLWEFHKEMDYKSMIRP